MFLSIEAGGTYSYHGVLKDSIITQTILDTGLRHSSLQFQDIRGVRYSGL